MKILEKIREFNIKEFKATISDVGRIQRKIINKIMKKKGIYGVLAKFTIEWKNQRTDPVNLRLFASEWKN